MGATLSIINVSTGGNIPQSACGNFPHHPELFPKALFFSYLNDIYIYIYACMWPLNPEICVWPCFAGTDQYICPYQAVKHTDNTVYEGNMAFIKLIKH